jgi:hypothetical protein
MTSTRCVIEATTCELIGALTLDPTRNYQPVSRPPGSNPADQPEKGSRCFRCLATSRSGPDETALKPSRCVQFVTPLGRRGEIVRLVTEIETALAADVTFGSAS